MKIVYRGGYNNTSEDSVKKSLWYEYADSIQSRIKKGEKIAVVTLAKPDGYYDKFINRLPEEIEVVDSKSHSLEWHKFNVIFIPGGETLQLYKALESKAFSLKALNKNVFILGDSAGAYVLSTYYYESPSGKELGKTIKFYEGFNPATKNIAVAHANNTYYCNGLLLKKAKDFAKTKDLEIWTLKENEEKTVEL